VQAVLPRSSTKCRQFSLGTCSLQGVLLHVWVGMLQRCEKNISWLCQMSGCCCFFFSSVITADAAGKLQESQTLMGNSGKCLSGWSYCAHSCAGVTAAAMCAVARACCWYRPCTWQLLHGTWCTAVVVVLACKCTNLPVSASNTPHPTQRPSLLTEAVRSLSGGEHLTYQYSCTDCLRRNLLELQ